MVVIIFVNSKILSPYVKSTKVYITQDYNKLEIMHLSKMVGFHVLNTFPQATIYGILHKSMDLVTTSIKIKLYLWLTASRGTTPVN